MLILGAVAAQQGHLHLPMVILLSFLGVLGSDQVYFHLGRIKGRHWIASRPRWQTRSQLVFRYLHTHQLWLMLGFRFLYGVRVVTPLLLGASGISPRFFLVCNLLNASVWALLFGTLGFWFGRTIEGWVEEMQRYQMWILGGVALTVGALWLLRRWLLPAPATNIPAETKPEDAPTHRASYE
ncbi:MAG: DedA family protein [Candidatus Sericytochromatia bacterium]|nr:DedA family protein [Candidatus Sericytochromatia bacterium]